MRSYRVGGMAYVLCFASSALLANARSGRLPHPYGDAWGEGAASAVPYF